MDNNYTVLHLHDEDSLLDSATKFQSYVDRAVELGQTAIASTNHGVIYNWVAKKIACDEAGIKFIHGCEVYLTEKLLWDSPDGEEPHKIRDNYHTILLAKNMDGIREINSLVSLSNREDHFYYKPRITFDEFLAISDNVIKLSACLASPLNKLPVSHKMYEKLVKHYNYLEVQPHNHPDQISYNVHLAELSRKYGIPLVATTDTHSLNQYKAECRTILQLAKHIEFADEDTFDLTYKTYDELVEMFRIQGALPEKLYLEAIQNTNVIADSVEQFELDRSFKYPILYGERDHEVLMERIEAGLQEKLSSGAIPPEQEPAFREAIKEEMRVFDKIEMSGFILFMHELTTWCKENNIPVGFGRGSCGGSRVAYLTDIIDINPETWHTIFSRFASESRRELGDIDTDYAPDDREKVYDHLIERFGQEKTAFILAIGTVKARGCIDEIVRALGIWWDRRNQDNKAGLNGNPWTLECASQIKDELAPIDSAARKIGNPGTSKYRTALLEDPAYKALSEKYPEVFKYFEGLLDTAISQSVHPAGIVVSPVTLRDNYGTFISDGKEILQIDMDCVHESGLVKYDLLGLKNIGIIRDTYRLLGKPYPKSHEIDWNDAEVWKDMLRSQYSIFQMESDFAYSLLKRFKPQSLFDMALLNAGTRPAGESYRNDLFQRKWHTNPSPILDELLKNSYGYIAFQEDTTRFLQEICGFSGSDADDVRRAIGRKDQERLDKALPKILDGYCAKSDKPREVAEAEAKEFLQIISDSSNYQFNYSHAIGYSMIGYLCAYLRYYHPVEFITAFLNNADNEDDIKNGTELAELYGVKIVPPRYGLSKDQYVCDSANKVIAKGIESIKFMNKAVANELYEVSQKHHTNSFMQLLRIMKDETSLNSRQRDILVKIDFFSDFGNVPELSRMISIFQLFKDGEAKKISKDKINDSASDIIANYATDKNKDGSEAKSYTITDMDGLLSAFEDRIKELNLPDVDLKNKIQTQLELMGYINLITNRSEDRRKLLITNIYPLSSKNDNKIWGYAVQTRSIGSGKTARLTLRANTFIKNPIKKFDIIYAKDLEKNKGGYWYLLSYDKVA